MSFPLFAEFFGAVNNHEPHGWQQDLADYLQEHGRWPWHVDVPTGLGKTSCIDIAVYELARQAHHGQHRTAPQRIFHVVDRRTIIDSAVEHARQLAQSITEARSGPLTVIRAALSTLMGAGSEEVVHVTGIHGQDVDDLQWMQRVTGCTIVSMTSHQFVSRLLFRGYGVSPRVRPIPAALCAIDRLVLFDEPHLSTQAVHTILAAERLQHRAQEDLGLPRSATVLLGATVPANLRELEPTVIRVSPDCESDAAKRRLNASRPTTMDWVAGSKSSHRTALVSAARDLVKAGAKRTVVFVNTVGMAQDVYKELSGTRDSSGAPAAIRLATSRFRPWDKPQKRDLEGPGVVVATQTLEVGVDLSFDALVTELCPWSSLLQRLGRFNRHGEYNEDKCFEQRTATVVAGWDDQKDQPHVSQASASVYGNESLSQCALLLRNLTGRHTSGVIDMNPSALKGLIPPALEKLGIGESALEPKEPRIGTLTSAMLPLMAQTRPTPEADIPVDALISGPDAPVSDDVDVVWRDHLDVFDIPDHGPSVSSREVLSIPRIAWMSFLAREKLPVEHLPDVENAHQEPRTTPQIEALTRYRVWDVQAESWVIPATDRQLVDSIRVIMSSELGGYTRQLGWTGSPVEEAGLDISWDAALADIARLTPRQRVDLVIRREQFMNSAPSNQSEAFQELTGAFEEVLEQTSNGIPAEDIDVAPTFEAAKNYVTCLISASPEIVIEILPESGPEVVIARVQLATMSGSGATTLDEHQAQVGAWAGADAAIVGLNDELVAETRYAGEHHDDGKRHGAFQQYLGCDPSGLPLLAKSFRSFGSDGADRRRCAEAGVPVGWRHEAESIRYVANSSALVRHLVGSHHGWFRPMLPPTVSASYADGYPSPAEHADDFDQLNRRFGVWGLAYLESLVRMADWRASAHPVQVSRSRASIESSRTDPPVVSGKTHTLPGLHSHPMTGWFAAVGLLAAASSTDPGAKLHWEPLPSDTSGTPLVAALTTVERLESLVQRIINSPFWQSSVTLTGRLPTASSLTATAQKVGPASDLHELLLIADEQQNMLLMGLLNDLIRAESSTTPKIPLAMAPFANNASYVNVAVKQVLKRDVKQSLRTKGGPLTVDEVLAALRTTSAGFSQEKCDGGMDRKLEDTPGVNGLGDPVTRFIRTALAPLALYGMASLGAGPPKGMGVVPGGAVVLPQPLMPVTTAKTTSMGVVPGDAVVLPLPRVAQTFAQLRALTYLGRGKPGWDWRSAGLEWIFAGQKKRLTEYEWAWIGQVSQRGKHSRH